MGQGIEYHCSRCDYGFGAMLGIGMAFPWVYRETMEKAGNGKLGSTLRRFLQEHPDGTLDCENVITRCSRCGELNCTMSLDMYVPKAGHSREQEAEDSRSADVPEGDILYVVPWDLEDSSTLFARYPHRCGKCHARADVIDEAALTEGIGDGSIACPRCGGRLEVSGEIMWD